VSGSQLLRSYAPLIGYGEPTSYLALEKGTDVISSDGERIGVVEHVLFDAGADIFDGLVIDSRLGPGGLRFIDAPEVGEIHEHGVLVEVAAADVPALPTPAPNPAVMENHGVEDSESKLAHKLHRAWEIVSGKG
jgi:hypothetical protein